MWSSRPAPQSTRRGAMMKAEAEAELLPAQIKRQAEQMGVDLEAAGESRPGGSDRARIEATIPRRRLGTGPLDLPREGPACRWRRESAQIGRRKNSAWDLRQPFKCPTSAPVHLLSMLIVP